MGCPWSEISENVSRLTRQGWLFRLGRKCRFSWIIFGGRRNTPPQGPKTHLSGLFAAILCYPGKVMSMATSDITIEILKEIRDGVRETNTRIDATNRRLGAVESTINQRLGVVETALLELAEQQRFVVRYTK